MRGRGLSPKPLGSDDDVWKPRPPSHFYWTAACVFCEMPILKAGTPTPLIIMVVKIINNPIMVTLQGHQGGGGFFFSGFF